jgi:hypothetical protein
VPDVSLSPLTREASSDGMQLPRSDAAIIAGPALAAAAGAVRIGDALADKLPAQLSASPLLPIAVYVLIAYLLGRGLCLVSVPLLRTRDRALNDAFILFLLSGGLILVLISVRAPVLVGPLAAAGAGTALAIRHARPRLSSPLAG